jgi:poly(A) polymerase
MLLGRRPKDFDVGTDAHPYQIKKLFRNCWIIGRRFRLAHVKFGSKTIEVATFRRVVVDTALEPGEAVAPPDSAPVVIASSAPPGEPDPSHGILHRDNTFGTPEEDAFRRDFTINGLFYDIATFSIIDYVGGLGDLERRVVRSIGDPMVRFVEDPVRMLRAGVMAARLGFDLDPLVVDAIAAHRELITKASPSRLMEEYYKILRSGYAEQTFRTLGRLRLLELITPDLKAPPDAVADSLSKLDRYRLSFADAPASLSNTMLIGALLQPLGLLRRASRSDPAHTDRVSFGMLPIARRDIERLRQVQDLVPRLLDPALPPRVARGLSHRPAFNDAVTWLEIFGDAPNVVASWKQVRLERAHGQAHGQPHPDRPGPGNTDASPHRRRRRRRRRRGRSGHRPPEGG